MAKIVSKSMYDRDAKCPYYKVSDGNHIQCEGMIPNTSIIINFRNRTDKGIYFRHYCSHDMNQCQFCQILNERYGVDRV
jgi:hypothetical protein